MKVLNVRVTNVNIRQQHRDFLRLTNNLSMKVLNIHVPNVNIRPIETFPHSLHITQSRLCDNFKEAFEDQVEGCDDEQFEIRPGQESGAHQVLF